MNIEDDKSANTIEHLVDHEDISKEQKKVAEDILQVINENESANIPLKFTVSQIKNNYQIEKIPMMDVSKSLWHEFTKDEKIGANIQGYRTIEKEGKKIRIPYVAFGADLDYLDEMVKRFVTRINSLKKE